ncbi:MAG: hypothetical protein RLN74_16845, partial [Ilumatobacter fluminis]
MNATTATTATSAASIAAASTRTDGTSREQMRAIVQDRYGDADVLKLATHLGVKPMSIYYYVANKDEIIDG